LIARFPTSRLAQRAQFWVGDFHFQRGQFEAAERSYQLVYQSTNWPVSSLTWEARLRAGRAALLRPSFANAVPYFTNLIEDTSAPESVRVLACFAFGDAFLLQRHTNEVEKFERAISIYNLVRQFHPNSPLVPRALGQMANCYFQLGAMEPTNYVAALDLYARATNAPDVSTRVLAQLGLGNVLRRQAQLAQEPARVISLQDAALGHYMRALYASYEEDKPDPVLLREAGINAAEMAESRNNWSSALEVYLRLTERLPAMRPALESRIATARERASLER
jgi:tetratricopeptide (TPR) repeat protein